MFTVSLLLVGVLMPVADDLDVFETQRLFGTVKSVAEDGVAGLAHVELLQMELILQYLKPTVKLK